MKLFCPTCDAVVTPESTADLRCPTCHRTLEPGPDAGVPVAAKASAKPLVFAGAALVLAALAGGAWWWSQRPAPATGERPAAGPAGSGATSADTASLATHLTAAGLSGAESVLPGTPDEALRTFAKSHADTPAALAALQARVAPDKLHKQPPSQRRRTQVLPSAALWAAVAAGKSVAVHPIEAAFLAAAMLDARGEPFEFVVESDGVQTPLLLSRTRIGVRHGGRVSELFAATPMQKPVVVPQATATAWWLVMRGHAHRLRAEFPQARQNLAAAAAIAPTVLAVPFAVGITDIDQGLQDKGVAACEAVLAKQEDPMARLFLAEVAIAQEQPVKALQRADEALRAYPALAEAHLTKGMLQAQRVATVPEAQKAALLAESKALIDKALSLDPLVPGGRAALAQFLLLQKDTAGAERVLTEAVEQSRDLEAALLLAQLLDATQRAPESVAMLEKLALPLEDERYVLALLGAYMGAKQPDKALALADKAHAQNPSNKQIALMRADLLRQTGKVKEAIAALEPLKSGEGGERVALLQAQLMMQNQQAPQAIPLLEAALAKRPGDREATMLLVVATLLSGDGDKALGLAKAALAQKTLSIMEAAGVFLQSGDAERATALLESAVQQPAPDPEAVATLAMVYTASGRKPDAEALRDKQVAAAGDKGAQLKAMVDQAIAGAEAEMLKAKQEPGTLPAAGHP